MITSKKTDAQSSTNQADRIWRRTVHLCFILVIFKTPTASLLLYLILSECNPASKISWQLLQHGVFTRACSQATSHSKTEFKLTNKAINKEFLPCVSEKKYAWPLEWQLQLQQQRSEAGLSEDKSKYIQFIVGN